MNDHIKSEISLFLAGGLTESRNRQIEAHAAACEKCRNALSKARAKQARVKREALKKASPDPLPNLFLARQGKLFGADRAHTKAPLFFVGILLLAGGGYWLLKHFPMSSRVLTAPITEPEPADVQTSSAPVSAAAPVVTPSVATVVQATTTVRAEPPKTPVVLPVQQEWKGVESGIKDARLVVIRDKNAWSLLWTEMQQKEPLPEVNFDEHVALGVFAGERPGVTSISFGKIRERGDEVTAPYRIIPLEVQVSSATPSVPTHPYLLGLIPHVDKKIRLTEREAQR